MLLLYLICSKYELMTYSFSSFWLKFLILLTKPIQHLPLCILFFTLVPRVHSLTYIEPRAIPTIILVIIGIVPFSVTHIFVYRMDFYRVQILTFAVIVKKFSTCFVPPNKIFLYCTFRGTFSLHAYLFSKIPSFKPHFEILNTLRVILHSSLSTLAFFFYASSTNFSLLSFTRNKCGSKVNKVLERYINHKQVARRFLNLFHHTPFNPKQNIYVFFPLFSIFLLLACLLLLYKSHLGILNTLRLLLSPSGPTADFVYASSKNNSFLAPFQIKLGLVNNQFAECHCMYQQQVARKPLNRLSLIGIFLLPTYRVPFLQ